ncbi:HlyD family type I secretion periplasmic adaptor subunit [Grimontia hollisae]|uniref:Membrane fusion protein (MFP) family protein n=2 Tax=Grimontia hollisae TaxID=673 RepID=D0I8W6_GRIHO|nr:HlyD family type I secretion periplasmic adaptor subunit [Grimontia hollisae]AMG28909.1 HlyD family type I secretion periplasmic adaptor subunit [Grimontia hollisae]EEY71881.1 ABC-type protease exporter membrane fusion protein (MFP) family component PrtE/AprE [Grimontia hollisae CIP 101886]STO77286.1 Type I secretion system membrane fusion protein PrsE [Grimontia hollisae]STO98390.1 Type I secretion system membrane fusion protein PrsE [Grimontia hollisae]STQ75784.1 Type I secretion system m
MIKTNKPSSTLPASEHLDYIDDKTAALLLSTPKSTRILLWVIALFIIVTAVWAAFAELDKVTVGQGKVIPSSQLQVVQNLEGGLIKKLLVHEGDTVEEGQQLLLIDDTMFRSDFRERVQELTSLQGDAVKLQSLVESVVVNPETGVENWQEAVTIQRNELVFTPEFQEEHRAVVARQRAEYRDKLNNLQNQLSVTAQQIRQKEQELIEVEARVQNLRQSYRFAHEEYSITKPLADEGVVPQIDLLKLQRQVNDTQRELSSAELSLPSITSSLQEAVFKHIDVALKFRAEQQERLSDVEDKLLAMTETRVTLADRVERTVVVSPVNGTIKKLHVNTVGGVIQPGMDLVEIVPSEDNLLIEAKIAPQDIAFLRPGLEAIVKFSAYDFTVYGGLTGILETISADTIQDEEGNSFYLVKIRTESNNLGEGEELPIIPGMTASTDIITGKRSVLDYLLKPILQAQKSALRE